MGVQTRFLTTTGLPFAAQQNMDALIDAVTTLQAAAGTPPPPAPLTPTQLTQVSQALSATGSAPLNLSGLPSSTIPGVDRGARGVPCLTAPRRGGCLPPRAPL